MSRGTWVFVCGPSGAGKDSVLARAQQRLAGDERIVFTRRMVTRPAGPALEHDEVSRGTIRRLAQADKLAWWWEANGHLYAVAGHYEVDIESGRIAVVNGSREHAATVPRDARHRRVLVTAPHDVLADRLRLRAREDEKSIADRLARNGRLGELGADLAIANDGELAQAGDRLAAYLQHLAGT